MTSPRSEREWLAELRDAASTEPVEPWLLHVVDERLAELGRTPERTPLASEPPVGSVVAADGSVFIRGQDDANGPVWRRAGHRSAYGWGNILAIGEAVLLRFGNDAVAGDAPTLEAEIQARTGTERAVLAVRLPDGTGPEWAAGRRVRLTLLPEEDVPHVD